MSDDMNTPSDTESAVQQKTCLTCKHTKNGSSGYVCAESFGKSVDLQATCGKWKSLLGV